MRKMGWVAGPGAVPGGGPTLSDRVSVEIANATLESIDKLNEIITQFDRNSSRLTKWMLVMTIIMVLLVTIQLALILN
jgi:hypothetical protein